MNVLRKVGNWLAPAAEQGDDGRDVWGSRASFILCAMGGAVGLGNLLRFPSIVFNNHGLQFFIPYLIALFFLAIPLLLLEISIGQAYRGGCVQAWHSLNKRTKGVGWSVVFNGYTVVTYYVPLLAWVMNYFRNSFRNPLPWTGRVDEFFANDVVANIDPIGPTFNDDGSIAQYRYYPGTGMVPETVGWAVFTWFVVWLCSFKGVSLTGRVIYFLMALPLIMIIILIGRSVSLPNAVDGIRLYFATWRSETLSSPTIWQEACGQIFFSIGVGFGYFTSYASYNTKYANAVQDTFIIAISNSLVEVIAAFAVFGIVGFLGITPDPETRLSTFTSGFFTYPEALAQMPAANFFAVIFFLTLFFLGLTSAFALQEAMVTMVMDTDWGKKISRWIVATAIAVVSFLISLMYCTQFGLALLDAVDTYVNYLALPFVAWSECVASTMIYRYKDVVDQTGWTSFLVYNIGFIFAQVFGVLLGHLVAPGPGAGLGFGLYIAATIAAIFLAKTPTVSAPSFWGNNVFLSRFWWLSDYSGNQLTRDFNVVIGTGKNWKIPSFWAPIIKYLTAPILAIIFSFAYPRFYGNRYDPVHIYGFAMMHIVMVAIVGLLIWPRFFDVFIPKSRRAEGDYPVAPMVTLNEGVIEREYHVEDGKPEQSLEKKTSSSQ